MELADIVLQDLISFLMLLFHQLHNFFVNLSLCLKGAGKRTVSAQILI